MAELPGFKLANGVIMPPISVGCAFGNWFDRSKYVGFTPEEAGPSFEQALCVGHRSFDGAHFYGTERIAGEVFRKHFIDGSLKRDDLFITTKFGHPKPDDQFNANPLRCLDPEEFHPKNHPGALEKRLEEQYAISLDDLGVGYADLLLLHWPSPFKVDWPDAVVSEWRLKAWRVMNKIYKRKGVRAIGVSNFSEAHLKDLEMSIKGNKDEGLIMPLVNQVEVHPKCFDKELVKYCHQNSIHITAYAPFGSGQLKLMTNQTIAEIAKKVDRTPAQVILRWLYQHGISSLPRSSSEERSKQNLQIADFELTKDQSAELDKLGEAMERTCEDPYKLK